MLQALGVARHHAFGSAIDVIGLAPPVAGHRANQRNGAVLGLLHVLGKGFSVEHGRDAIDVQCFVAGLQVVLALRLLGQRAVGNQRDVERARGTHARHHLVDGSRV